MKVAWIIWLLTALVSPWLALRQLFQGSAIYTAWVLPISVASAVLTTAIAVKQKNIGAARGFLGWLGLTIFGCIISLATFLPMCAALVRR